MTVKIQIIIIVCMVISIGYIAFLTRKKKIDFKYALVWMLVAAMVLAMAIWPKALSFLSDMLGISTPVNMLFFLGFIFSLGIIFTLSRTVSELLDKVKKLSQELAILRKDTFDSLNKK